MNNISHAEPQRSQRKNIIGDFWAIPPLAELLMFIHAEGKKFISSCLHGEHLACDYIARQKILESRRYQEQESKLDLSKKENACKQY